MIHSRAISAPSQAHAFPRNKIPDASPLVNLGEECNFRDNYQNAQQRLIMLGRILLREESAMRQPRMTVPRQRERQRERERKRERANQQSRISSASHK